MRIASSNRMGGRTADAFSRKRRKGFTLAEVLVVMGVIAMLLSILLPGLSAARAQAKGVMCRSNIRQLAVVNQYYSEDHGGVYCPGASEFLKNLDRWHGRRDHPNEAFDSRRGPLAIYLGPEAEVRQCPTFPAEEITRTTGGFERGNGGYGYNNAFIGVQLSQRQPGEYVMLTDRAGVVAGHVARPGRTIMFADSAFAGDGLIEYSFAEPRYHPLFPLFRATPSVHFRHRGLANVVWCDGHVDAHERTFTHDSGFYPTSPEQFDIGWFGDTDDNRLFDLR